MGSIIEFIDARLREDEYAARAVDGERRAWREVLAKRLIVTLAQLPDGGGSEDRLLRCVALCWADHADYRPEWIL
ncbi:hypothetical protein B7C42_00015 [Nocardia cerradoensis]|uniref:Uncharacterized protein n=1 Tax=Nocardia cerradoensis TaxID=85688 RepID=A0A231HD96_9NOCA|nr:DUF6221 family protein [Nocardia cerradoensis]OXR46901.1 hypothetical protein B7C42_00015 [Nocardia cerradoensis]